MTNPTTLAQSLLEQAASLLVYQSVLAAAPGQAFLELLHTIVNTTQASDKSADRLACLRAYGRWFTTMADCDQSWSDYLEQRILQDDNPFTRQAQHAVPAALVAAARHDLRQLQSLSRCGEQLSQWVQAACQTTIAPIVWSEGDRSSGLGDDWGDRLEELVTHYRKAGTGVFGTHWALRWQAGQLVGVDAPDPVQVSDLVGYEMQKQALLKNTEALLQGYPALHVLLYGSRGSGKSSLVKGLLHQYGDRGLRLIEVAKADLLHLPELVDRLRDLLQKFVIFVDDLSFEEDEDAYKALKVVLEGNLTARSQNLVVYATSNRRHLIREFFGDRPSPRDADEVHSWDTVQEKLSFSDRFGLTLTFEPADQKTYLAIVQHLTAPLNLAISAADLEFRALQWATRHNGRSGRTARQFVDFLRADFIQPDTESQLR